MSNKQCAERMGESNSIHLLGEIPSIYKSEGPDNTLRKSKDATRWRNPKTLVGLLSFLLEEKGHCYSNFKICFEELFHLATGPSFSQKQEDKA